MTATAGQKMDIVSTGIIWIRKEEEAGTLLVSHVTEPHYTHTSPKPETLSSVYYTGLRGEIELKWQLLGEFLRRVKLTCTQWRLSDWSTWSYCVHLPGVWSYHRLCHVVTLWLLLFFYTNGEEDWGERKVKNANIHREEEIHQGIKDVTTYQLYIYNGVFLTFTLCIPDRDLEKTDIVLRDCYKVEK